MKSCAFGRCFSAVVRQSWQYTAEDRWTGATSTYDVLLKKMTVRRSNFQHQTTRRILYCCSVLNAEAEDFVRS